MQISGPIFCSFTGKKQPFSYCDLTRDLRWLPPRDRDKVKLKNTGPFICMLLNHT